QFAGDILRRHGLAAGGFVVCVPPARWADKRWPVRHWRTLLGELARQCPAVLIGAPNERDLCAAISSDAPAGVIDLSGQTTVPNMVALIAQSAGVISCDSAAKFIAPAVGVGCVTLIGPTQVERTGPFPTGTAVVAATPCQGCLRRRCRHVTCMELIEPARVLQAARDMLAKRQEEISGGDTK
ncbi:MAG: glycosyltransferase family 9 protein, partial [Planctomycetota bacterium]|nr:glycosyltransferase family 9 protein [Planctomycetota bacterium]